MFSKNKAKEYAIRVISFHCSLKIDLCYFFLVLCLTFVVISSFHCFFGCISLDLHLGHQRNGGDENYNSSFPICDTACSFIVTTEEPARDLKLNIDMK